jgi:hypothetical protein
MAAAVPGVRRAPCDLIRINATAMTPSDLSLVKNRT